jgi:hypothetical protein
MGFDVSRPGFDVRTASLLQMAFTTKLKVPKVVVSGSLVMNPTLGNKSKDFNIPGGQATLVGIPFPTTYSPYPMAIGICSSSNWNIPLPQNTSQLTNLVNKWHTPIWETFWVNGDLTYGTNVNHAAGDANTVSVTWACCRFVITMTGSGMTIWTNSRAPVSVKYLVLDYNN